MNLSFRIAKRYLFAKKSHNVINVISLISAVGIAIGTCALIIVLSIYNGFESIVKGVYQKAEADLVITPNTGKAFNPSDSVFREIRSYPHVSSFYEVVEDNAFLVYGKAQGIVLIKGVDTIYGADSRIQSCMLKGDFNLYFGDVAQAVVGRTLAQTMRIQPYLLEPLELYFPAKGRDVSMMNPLSSLNKEVLFPIGIISVEQNLDREIMFIPIDVARNLCGYTCEVTSLEINIDSPELVEKARTDFSEMLGEGFSVKDRYRQNETVYKMMSYEKMAIYMILLFIIIIISCNVFGSLTMLILEKKDDIWTLKGMGANDKLVKRIFVQEGWLIIFYGMLAGVVLGIVLCLIQQYFGVIKMPGNFIVTAYPVVIKFTDILITVAGVAAVGFFISAIPAWRTLPGIYQKYFENN